MPVGTGVAIFFLIWWIVLFAVLPWGVHRQDEEGNYVPRDFADWREIPLETLERKEVRQKLAEALASLGEKYREVFAMRDLQHLSIEETAKTLGISTASVKTRLLRARLMLRDLLAPGLGGSWSK